MISQPDEDLRQDAEELLNFLVPIAFHRIENDDAFQPFGAVVLTEGGVEPIDVEGESDADEEPDVVFTAILESIRGQAENAEFRTAGLCADVHIVKEEDDEHTDAVRVYMERRDGEAMDVFLPYSRNEEGGIEKGQVFAVEAMARLFIKVDPEAPSASA